MTASAYPPSGSSLLERVLAEQRELTAVERFAQHHRDAEEPLLAAHYRELLPTERSPGAGEQFAFRVDLDACTGCKACVTACHSLNGLRPDEAWREVGLVVDVGTSAGDQQTVTTACHHCIDPGCLRGCPAQAYEKDSITGIVRHLDDQCIGCQYCVLTCPYDVPSFDASLGIVRKCDLCADRLSSGEAPACAQGCPTSAISIDIVSTTAEPGALLSGLDPYLPDSSLTRPTTRYVSARPARPIVPADAALVKPNHAHAPLAFMLVFVQLSTGILVLDAVARGTVGPAASGRLGLLAFALGAAVIGLAGSIAHLGRPTQAFRAVLGWRTSWMSREILAFGAYLAALCAAVLAEALGNGAVVARWAALLAGIVATACSIGVYAATGRAWWSAGRTIAAFGSTQLLLGGAGMLCVTVVAALSAGAPSSGRLLVGGLFAVVVGGASLVRVQRFTETPASGHDLERSRSLLRGPLRSSVHARVAVTAVGLLLVVAAVGSSLVGSDLPAAGVAGLALLTLTLGEFLDRRLFFAAEAARAMPGL
ncbi:MAG: dimethyl sulfoxide reductase anchor subunit [Candidatus Binatia bacterium]|nr:dimethyl sulfoxide reductase anchor subunit [Candidatus Binatia bacterium]